MQFPLYSVIVEESIPITLPKELGTVIKYKLNEYIEIENQRIPFEWTVFQPLKNKIIMSKQQPPQLVLETSLRWIFKNYTKVFISYLWCEHEWFTSICMDYFVHSTPNLANQLYFDFIMSAFDSKEELINELQLVHALNTPVDIKLPEIKENNEIDKLKELLATMTQQTTPAVSKVPTDANCANAATNAIEKPHWKTYDGLTCYERVSDFCKKLNKLCQFKYKYNSDTKEYLYKVIIDGKGTDLSQTQSSQNQQEAQDIAARLALKMLLQDQLMNPTSSTYVDQLKFFLDSQYKQDIQFQFQQIDSTLFSITATINKKDYTSDRVFIDKQQAKEYLSHSILNQLSSTPNKRQSTTDMLINHKSSKYRQLLHTLLDQKNANYTYTIDEFIINKKCLFTAQLDISFMEKQSLFSGNFKHKSKDQAKEEVAQLAYESLHQ